MKIYPILNNLGKGKYVFIFILNERAVLKNNRSESLRAVKVGMFRGDRRPAQIMRLGGEGGTFVEIPFHGQRLPFLLQA